MKTLLRILVLSFALVVGAVAGFTNVTVSAQANPASQGITSYKVYERTGTVAAPVYTLVGSAPTPSVTFPVPANVTVPHYYVMTAVSVVGESSKSQEVTLPVLPTAPTSLVLVIQ